MLKIKPIKFSIFTFVLALVLLILASVRGQHLISDYDEYALMTVAFSSHLSPDIRIRDIAEAVEISPINESILKRVEPAVETHSVNPTGGFYRGNDGKIYAIHYFAYSVLSVVPFKVLKAIGVPAFKCFYFVNAAFVLILGMSLFRFFGSAPKATIGLLLFFLCGGTNYFYWTGPEIMGAAGLCAGLLFFSMRSYLLAGLLIGLSSTQNPPIVLALFFAPLFQICLTYNQALGWYTNVKNVFSLKMMAGLSLGFALFLTTICFNFAVFGVPNIIARVAADPSLISLARLFSYFFDLSQGMIIAIPAVWLGTTILVIAKNSSSISRFQSVSASLSIILFSLALALPCLTTANWNSGAIGMMRYVFWGGMPCLFLFYTLMKVRQNSMHWVVVGTLALQLICAIHAHQYHYVQHSSLAKFVLANAPRIYNPEPEIFIERTVHKDGIVLDRANVYSYSLNNDVKKIIFHDSQGGWKLCGEQAILDPSIPVSHAGDGWYYLDGAIQCKEMQLIDYKTFNNEGLIRFSGWSGIEVGGNEWNGRWSVGKVSTITINLSPARKVEGVQILGHYFKNNRRTKVIINGKDFGPQDLLRAPTLAIDGNFSSLEIVLQHEAPHDSIKDPNFPDKRELALFLESIRYF